MERHGTGGVWALGLLLLLIAPHLDSLPAAARSSSPHGGDRAACPVQGRPRFSDDWHAPRVGHLHQGNDLFAAYGTPVVAVEAGTVGRVGYAGIGGLRVWLHGRSGAAYYYAHLSAATVRPGQRVARGARLGRVGNTGNAASTPPHLHFEVHPGGGAAVNPYPRVRRWCR
jgi:murein DD-endopeptidase MepM/ murein hydrolase activator NlpD